MGPAHPSVPVHWPQSWGSAARSWWGDVALLRAGGAEIEATPRGYQFHPTPGGYTGILACVHRTADEMRTELYTVVDQGAWWSMWR